jgi:hypothetical protein
VRRSRSMLTRAFPRTASQANDGGHLDFERSATASQ